MNTDLILELAPHYVAMLVAVFASLAVLRATAGNLGLVPELGVALVVVFLYPFVVRRLGYAPSVWED
jgi:hypothetical protein